MFMEFAENALNMKLLHRNAIMAVKNYNYLIASKYNLWDWSSKLPIPVDNIRLKMFYLFEKYYPFRSHPPCPGIKNCPYQYL